MIAAAAARLILRRQMSTAVVPGLNRLHVDILGANADNYMYVVRDQAVKDCVIVDPCDSDKIIDFMTHNELKLVCVLTTHHHSDHAGGNLAIKKTFRVPVYGGDGRIEGLDRVLDNKAVLRFGALRIQVLQTPGHTSGHVCYLLDLPSNPNCPPVVFTGDTLFVSGCGRFFEGSPQEMYTSLYDTLGGLEPNTRVYCGHEYTLKNLDFAMQVEPNNQELIAKREWALQRTEHGLPTVPSTIGDEFTYNPFLRANQKTVQEYCRKSGKLEGDADGQDPVACLACLRNIKDTF